MINSTVHNNHKTKAKEAKMLNIEEIVQDYIHSNETDRLILWIKYVELRREFDEIERRTNYTKKPMFFQISL